MAIEKRAMASDAINGKVLLVIHINKTPAMYMINPEKKR
jgi:hypothetical protein